MIDQRGQKSDLSNTIAASEPATIVPLNQEALRPSCDITLPNVEKALKAIENNLPDAETQPALIAVDKVLSQLSEDDQAAFVSAVLPQMIERSSLSPTFGPLKMLNELVPLAESRALKFSLPLLLRALPEARMETFIGRLQAISNNCGSCQEVVLTQILPDYIRSAGDKFTSSMFYSFQELCKILKENTQKAFELLGPIFGSPPECNMDPRLPTFLRDVLGFGLTSESAYKGLEFCAELLKLIDIAQPNAIRKIFDSGIKAWSNWGASKQAVVAEQLLALMKHIGIKFSTAAAKNALSCLNNPDTAQAIIAGSFALPKMLSAEQFLSHLERVNRVIERFPREFRQAVAEYFSISVIKEQERVCEKLLHSLLFDSYNARRIGPHLAFLSQALKRFSQQDFDVLSEELVNLPGVLSELIERKDAVDYTPLNYILLRVSAG